jgi:uncharacterized protein (DUF433 family)
MATSTGHRYVVNDPAIVGGEPIIAGTRTPVRAIVEIWRMGTPPEQIPDHLPHLTLAQVFDALSYFSDHVDEINLAFKRNGLPSPVPNPTPGQP